MGEKTLELRQVLFWCFQKTQGRAEKNSSPIWGKKTRGIGVDLKFCPKKVNNNKLIFRGPLLHGFGFFDIFITKVLDLLANIAIFFSKNCKKVESCEKTQGFAKNSRRCAKNSILRSPVTQLDSKKSPKQKA